MFSKIYVYALVSRDAVQKLSTDENTNAFVYLAYRNDEAGHNLKKCFYSFNKASTKYQIFRHF
jgi:hypothetical protein